MVPLPTQSLRAIRGLAASRRRWTDWLASLTPAQIDSLSVLKDSANVTVYAAIVDHRPVVLKVSVLAGLAHKAYAAVGSTRGCRHWRGSRRLHTLGLSTPTCHALVHGRSEGARVEVLVMDRVAGRTLLEHLACPTLPVRAQHRVACALANQCADMARAGVFNRDHKPSNIVVVKASADDALLAILDTVAVRPLARPGPTAPPLERLIIEAIGIGATPRRSLIARFLTEWIARSVADPSHRPAALRATWATLSARVEAHGNPTPTDNPLSAGVAARR